MRRSTRSRLAEVERITERIRAELAIADEPRYSHHLTADPAMFADTPAEVEREFHGYYRPHGADGTGYCRHDTPRLPERSLLQAASAIYPEGCLESIAVSR